MHFPLIIAKLTINITLTTFCEIHCKFLLSFLASNFPWNWELISSAKLGKKFWKSCVILKSWVLKDLASQFLNVPSQFHKLFLRKTFKVVLVTLPLSMHVVWSGYDYMVLGRSWGFFDDFLNLIFTLLHPSNHIFWNPVCWLSQNLLRKIYHWGQTTVFSK